MSNKEKYKQFQEKIYVPIYSKSWWMDAVCGSDAWDVWLYEKGGMIHAAMPYYIEKKGEYCYITKALLTQNNGILFQYPDTNKLMTLASFEEEIINAACDFIEASKLDVYEQQYQYTFTNWLPFYWRQYTAITRYTFVIDTTVNETELWQNISSKYRKNIKKGERNTSLRYGMQWDIFYGEHEKVFSKQALPCPFSKEQWKTIYEACIENHAGEISYAEDSDGKILSLLFCVWDEKAIYLLMGGNIPEYSHLETYSFLIWKSIEKAKEKNLLYDFEGSVIKKISKSFREFGGAPKPYFRIRKVFNGDIVDAEAEAYKGGLFRNS